MNKIFHVSCILLGSLLLFQQPQGGITGPSGPLAKATLLAHVTCAGAGGCTTSAVDTTGATFIVACTNAFSILSGVNDNKSNSYSALTAYGSGLGTQIYYTIPTTVGAGTTFTNGASTFSVLDIQVWKNTAASSVFQAGTDKGATGAGNSIQPGSATPSGPSLVISCATSYGTGTATIDSGFTITDQTPDNGGVNIFGAMAYLIQNSGSALNPTWSQTSGGAIAANQAAFVSQ